MSNLDIATNYANDCLSDVIPSCIYVKQAAQRFLSDLERSDIEFREEKVNHVVKFLKNLELVNVEKITAFNPEPWQVFIIANIYGFYLSGTDSRKYRYIYIEVPRKNGKSYLINALAFYHFIFDTYSSVLVNANSREQVKEIDFKMLKWFALQLDPEQEEITNYYNSITYGNNTISVLSGNIKALDGYNPSTIIIDEYHSATNMDSYNVMKSGLGSRENPLMYVITTAGFNVGGACYQLREYNTSVLSGVAIDDSSFSIIYTLDEKDSITTPNAIAKANPNLGVSVSERFFKDEITKATQNPSELIGVEVKNFNVWQKSKYSDLYIDEQFIKDAFSTPIKMGDFVEIPAICGFDLGSVNDITAIAFLFVKDGFYNFFVKYYLPQDSLGTVENKMLYEQWARAGYLNITHGNVTDYDSISSELIKLRDTYMLQSFHYDSHNSTQLAVNLTSNGFYLIPYSQTICNFNAPTKELKRLMMSGKVRIEKNPITSWMLQNCVLKTDAINGNVKPVKVKESKKIDGVIAMLMGLGGYLKNPQREMNIY